MDQFYFEAGYLETGYFSYIAEAECNLTVAASVAAEVSVADTTGYYIPDYIEEGYYVAGETVEFAAALEVAAAVTIAVTKIIQAAAEFTAAFSPTLTVEVFKNHTASLDVAFDLESTAVKTVDPGGLLEFFADLNNAADRFRDNVAAISAEFTVGGNNGIGDIDTNVILESAASLESSAALSCDAESITYISASAALSATAIVAAEGIEYQLRPNTYNRPINLIIDNQDSFVTSPVKYGSHSLKVVDTGGARSDTSPAFSIDLNEDFVAEGWFNIDNTNSLVTAAGTMLFSLGASEDNIETASEPLNITRRAFSVGLTLTSGGNRTFLIRYRNGLSWSRGTTTQLQPSSDTWFHLAVVRESNVLKLLYNGTVIFSTSHSQAWAIDSLYSRVYFRHNYTVDSADNVYYDSFRFARGTATITGLSSQPEDSDQTVVLYNFNNSLQDGYVRNITFNAVASLASNFAQTVAATTLNSGSAEIAAESTLSTIVGKIQPAAAEFESVASQLTAAAKVGDFLIDAAVTANFDITPDLFKEHSAAIASGFAQSTQAVKSVEAGSDLVVEFTMVTENQGIISGVADLVSAFASTATGATTKPGSADLDAEFTLTASAIKAVEAAGSASSEFAMSTDVQRIRDNSSTFESVAAQLTAAAKIGDFLIDASVAANLTVSGNVLTGSIVAIDSAASTSITAVKTVVVSSNVAAESQISIDAVVGVVAEGDFESTVLLAIDADVIKRAVVAASSTATLAASGNVTARAQSTLAATASVVAASGRTRPASSAISSAAQLNITAGKLASGAANLPAVSAVLAVGREVRLDVYVYRIPTESRTASIAREIREYEIRQETRTHSIQGT